MRVPALLFVPLVLAPTASAAPQDINVTFRSEQSAYEQGKSAYLKGQCSRAIPAFEFAAKRRVFGARYFLARIFGNEQSVHYDQSKACKLLLEFASRYGDTDPADHRRSTLVADGLTRLGKYVLHGCPGIGLPASPGHAFEYIYHAATQFDFDDAQYELAWLYLNGHGTRRSPSHAWHWLGRLARKGHAGAMAAGGKMAFQGRHLVEDRVCGLAMISTALKNAPPEDRLWIEDEHQSMICEATNQERRIVSSMLPDWFKRYRYNSKRIPDCGFPELTVQVNHACADGRPARPIAPPKWMQAAQGAPGRRLAGPYKCELKLQRR